MSEQTPNVFVTNFNPRFTGVSSTTAAALREQLKGENPPALVGVDLPLCPTALSKRDVIELTAKPLTNRPFRVLHVRRNTEMWFGLYLRDVLRRPVKLVFTSAAMHRHSAVPRWLISRMDAVIATSERAASHFQSVQAIVPHGVAIDLFNPSPDRAVAWDKLGYGGSFGIANLGRVRPDKGTDIAVQSLIDTLPDYPDVTGLIIGLANIQNKEFVEGLKRKVRKAGLSERIIFTGELPQEEVLKIIPALSGYLAVPRYEPYGMTVLEAMSCGVPVVASDTGTYARALDGPKCGTLVPLDNVAATSQGLRHLFSNRDQVERWGEAARKKCVEKFSIKQEVEGIEKVYDELWSSG